VAIADVDALVKKDTPIDPTPWLNTTSVYTSARIFPMLPERLCTDLTSLNPAVDRLALVTEMVFNADGTLAELHRLPRAGAQPGQAGLRRGLVPGSRARLTCLMPPPRCRHGAAAAHPGRGGPAACAHAAMPWARWSWRPSSRAQLFEGEQLVDIRQQVQNRARQLIEEVMIATNGCTARYLARAGRRLAAPGGALARALAAHRGTGGKDYGDVLPDEPDSKALEAFLAKQHRADPLRFPDLSLVIVKLMGRASTWSSTRRRAHRPLRPGGARLHPLHRAQPALPRPDHLAPAQGHAGGQPAAVWRGELNALAEHCTQQEDAARKVERRMRKSEAALLLESHLGQHFDALVTGQPDSRHMGAHPHATGRRQAGGRHMAACGWVMR
jgi:exoribonuclease-2